MRNIFSSKTVFALALLIFGLLAVTTASAFESRVYGERKTKVNPKSRFKFPRAMEIYNIDLAPHQDNSALIRRLHAEGKRVICFLRSTAKPKHQSKSIENAMNAGCDEVAIR